MFYTIFRTCKVSSPNLSPKFFRIERLGVVEPSLKFFRIDTRLLNKNPAITGSLNKGLAHATHATRARGKITGFR